VFTDIHQRMTEVRSGQEALVERRLLRRARSDTCAHISSSREGIVLHTLLTRRHPDFKGCAGRHRAVAAALDHAHVKKGIATAWKLNEAKALFRVVPLHRGRNRRTGRSRFEAGAALTRRIPEIRRRRVVVIIEASPLRSPGISVYAHAPLGCAGQARYCRARVLRRQCLPSGGAAIPRDPQGP
jgi:hypothetical protein